MKTKITLIAFLSVTGMMSAQAPVKKVLLEEFTTTLCGNCPPKSFLVHQWYEQHPNTSILMTHHAGFGTDALTTTDASTYANYFDPSTFGFAPAIMIDRDVYPWVDSVVYMSVNGFDTIASRIANTVAHVAVNITGSYNSTTRQLSITSTGTFDQVVSSGPKRMCIYVVEDSVIGSGNGYDQKCYDGTWANAHFPGQYSASDQHILQYPHRNVQRASISGGTWGTMNIIPNSPVVGTPYSVTATYTLPANFNDSRISIVAMVAEYGPNHITRKIWNANSVKLSDLSSTTTAVAESITSSEINAMYPNPAVNDVTLAMTIRNDGNTSITVNNLMGQQVAEFEKGAYLNAGRYQATFSTATLPSGVYVISMKNENETVTRKLVIEK